VILHLKDSPERISPTGILVDQTDQDGHFQFRSAIPPGTYELIALDSRLDADRQNIDAVRSCFSSKTEITLAAREQNIQTITVVACDAGS